MVEARGRFNAIKEQVDEREIAPKRRALVGRCFRYRNCYSCPDKPSDYWWLWLRIVGVDGGCVLCVQTERDKYGKITIENHAIPCFDGTVHEAYRPVTRRQYDRATSGMLAQARKLLATPTP